MFQIAYKDSFDIIDFSLFLDSTLFQIAYKDSFDIISIEDYNAIKEFQIAYKDSFDIIPGAICFISSAVSDCLQRFVRYNCDRWEGIGNKVSDCLQRFVRYNNIILFL